jgi:hypothetical protein
MEYLFNDRFQNAVLYLFMRDVIDDFKLYWIVYAYNVDKIRNY